MSDAIIGAMRTGWQEASLTAPGPRAWRAVRIRLPGPVAVFAAIRESDGARCLLFETGIHSAPHARARFDADGMTLVEDRNFNEQVYRIAVALERHDLGNIFDIIVANLVDAAHSATSPAAANLAISSRLAAWQAFLRTRRSGLGRESVIGLIGELIVLGILIPLANGADAVDAWKGPFDGIHDFSRRGHATEVKTSAGLATAAEITSLDQLEDAGLSALLLVHVHLAESPAGITLPVLAGQLRESLLRDAPGAVSSFQDALLAAGYAEVDSDLYLNWMFEQIAVRTYRVTTGFPRLTRQNIVPGIAAVRYRVEFRALEPFLLDNATALGIMASMGGPL